jgi:hypothetical protein
MVYDELITKNSVLTFKIKAVTHQIKFLRIKKIYFHALLVLSQLIKYSFT